MYVCMYYNVSTYNYVYALVDFFKQFCKNMSAKETVSGKRKRSATEPDATSTKKPLQKLRAPNAYNIFSQEFFQSDGNYLHMYYYSM